MASHYVSLTRGLDGSKMSDFTTGTSSAATDLFELRILDGVMPSKVEVLKALKGFERYFENAQQGGVGFDIKG